MQFYEVLDEVLDEVLELLRSRGRVSYGALKRQYDVDDEFRTQIDETWSLPDSVSVSGAPHLQPPRMTQL